MPDTRNLNRRVLSLSQEKLQLEQTVKSKDEQIARLSEEQKKQASSYQQKAEADQLRLEEKDREIHRLKNQLEEVARKARVDESLVQELTTVNLQKDELEKHVQLKTHRVIELENDLQKHQRQLQQLSREKEDIEQLYQQEQLEKTRLQLELDELNRKTQLAFKATEISQYLTNAINAFNIQVNTGNAAVNYIINGMDVEMKSYVARDEDNEMMLTAPSLSTSSEEGLSKIKFSISAVPKDMASQE